VWSPCEFPTYLSLRADPDKPWKQQFYPALRRAGINFSALKKITLGFFTGALAMVWAAVVQHYIYKTSPCGYHANDCTGTDTSPLNVWIQTGS